MQGGRSEPQYGIGKFHEIGDKVGVNRLNIGGDAIMLFQNPAPGVSVPHSAERFFQNPWRAPPGRVTMSRVLHYSF
jgi:hypothetical protein